MAQITLVLGGARSGKSLYAEELAISASNKPIYIATAQAFDDEMQTRIDKHQYRRNKEWQTVEVPLHLAKAISEFTSDEDVILVDCLTVWIGNLMAYEQNIEVAIQDLLKATDEFKGTLICVACEVGLGIVPDNKQARLFRDYAGTLNSTLAQKADQVFFVAAGLPLTLKGK